MIRRNLDAIAPKKLNSGKGFSTKNNRILSIPTTTYSSPSYSNETFSFVVDWQLSNLESNQIDQSKSPMKKDYF